MALETHLMPVGFEKSDRDQPMNTDRRFIRVMPNVRFRPIADIRTGAHIAHMKPSAALSIKIAATLLACGSGQATAKGGEERWIAYSRTARAITGDIFLSPTRLRAAGTNFPLKVISDLPEFRTDLDVRVAARVLAVTRRMNPKLRNGNTLGCGRGQPIRWIVVWQYDAGKGLGMATFAGSRMPTSAKNAGLCGSYSYFRN